MNHYITDISEKLGNDVTYVLPVSDNGGSSRMILEKFGGPAIGDIRNRLMRLADHSNIESFAMSYLLIHRLSIESKDLAFIEFLQLLNEIHPIWSVLQSSQIVLKKSILAFLKFFWSSISPSPPNSSGECGFDFRGASVGNLVLTGARLFFGSLDTAIFWFHGWASIPLSIHVFPVINCDINISAMYNIAAELIDGSIIYGQDSISHPKSGTIVVDKSIDKLADNQLPSAIQRVFYYDNNDMSRVFPSIHPAVIDDLQASSMIVRAFIPYFKFGIVFLFVLIILLYT